MMVTENRRKNCCFLLFIPIIAQICTVCNSICKKKIGKLQKKSGTAIGFAAPDSVLLSADATYFRNRLRMMSVPSLIPPPTSTHSKINPNKPPIQHTSFLKKRPAFCFCSKINPDRTSVRAVFQNPFSSSSYRGVLDYKIQYC